MRPTFAIAVLTASALAAGLSACGNGKGGGQADTVVTHPLPDTLRVATLYSPTSYFIYREEEMGYDYALVSDWASDKGMVLDVHVAPRLETAIQWLDSAKVDIIAYQVPVTDAYNRLVLHCGPVSETSQILVQSRARDTLITDVTQLIGHDVYVERNSKYHQRINNLNSELGGGIRIHPVDRDTLITEDLMEMVAKGEIPMTIVDSDIAKLNRTYYPGLDISLSVSFGQKAQWAVARNHEWLADSVNAWFAQDRPKLLTLEVYRRYFEESKTMPHASAVSFRNGKVSPYDELFKQYAKEIGWDWRLLAAIGYVESGFDSSVVSWAGARGIMQIMPVTARAMGSSPEAMSDPATSIRIAVKAIQSIDKMMARYISDPEKRRPFVIASYNSGGAHIIDAIALARKHGHNPEQWHGSVDQALLMKSDPTHYNDPVVKYGYFRGVQTVEFVRRVENFYNKAKKYVKQ